MTGKPSAGAEPIRILIVGSEEDAMAALLRKELSRHSGFIVETAISTTETSIYVKLSMDEISRFTVPQLRKKFSTKGPSSTVSESERKRLNHLRGARSRAADRRKNK